LLLPNPWQALQAMGKGYQVIAMAGEVGDFKGLFVVRRDSTLRRPTDLRGRAVAYPAATAVAACMLPQWFLARHGVDVVRDIDNRYVGTQESAILAALHGEVAAAATWPLPWRAFQKDHPLQAAQLRVIWQTAPLVNNAVMVRNDLPAALRAQLSRLLLSLHESPEGRAALAGMGASRVMPADDASYAPMRRFLADFEGIVRPVGIL
jgi:phosphonate transport system substrate-binding protein